MQSFINAVLANTSLAGFAGTCQSLVCTQSSASLDDALMPVVAVLCMAYLTCSASPQSSKPCLSSCSGTVQLPCSELRPADTECIIVATSHCTALCCQPIGQLHAVDASVPAGQAPCCDPHTLPTLPGSATSNGIGSAPEPPGGPLHKDAFLVLRALCKLSIRTSESLSDPTAVRHYA